MLEHAALARAAAHGVVAAFLFGLVSACLSNGGPEWTQVPWDAAAGFPIYLCPKSPPDAATPCPRAGLVCAYVAGCFEQYDCQSDGSWLYSNACSPCVGSECPSPVSCPVWELGPAGAPTCDPAALVACIYPDRPCANYDATLQCTSHGTWAADLPICPCQDIADPTACWQQSGCMWLTDSQCSPGALAGCYVVSTPCGN